jgi:hypothetical protein
MNGRFALFLCMGFQYPLLPHIANSIDMSGSRLWPIACTTGATVERLIVLPLGTREKDDVGRPRQAAGLSVRIEYEKIFVNDVTCNSVA